MIALMLTVTVALVFYLDFKYGFSLRPGENVPTEVRERDYFFFASFLLWGVWVAQFEGVGPATIVGGLVRSGVVVAGPDGGQFGVSLGGMGRQGVGCSRQ